MTTDDAEVKVLWADQSRIYYKGMVIAVEEAPVDVEIQGRRITGIEFRNIVSLDGIDVTKLYYRTYRVYTYKSNCHLSARPDPSDRLVITYLDENGETKILSYSVDIIGKERLEGLFLYPRQSRTYDP